MLKVSDTIRCLLCKPDFMLGKRHSNHSLALSLCSTHYAPPTMFTCSPRPQIFAHSPILSATVDEDDARSPLLTDLSSPPPRLGIYTNQGSVQNSWRRWILQKGALVTSAIPRNGYGCSLLGIWWSNGGNEPVCEAHPGQAKQAWISLEQNRTTHFDTVTKSENWDVLCRLIHVLSWEVLIVQCLCVVRDDHSTLFLSLANQNAQLGDAAALWSPRIRQASVWRWVCCLVYQGEESARWGSLWHGMVQISEG